MSDKKKKAEQIVKDLAGLFGMEHVKLTSELAAGSYTLEDGTTFDIDEEGNLVNVVAKTPEEAEAQEAAETAEEAVALAKAITEGTKEVTEKLTLSTAKVAELEAEIVKLKKVKKIIVAPKVGKVEKIQLSANAPYGDRVNARLFNMLKATK